MEEKEELKQELEQELRWVKYRQRILDIIEEKLLQIKQMIELTRHSNLSEQERQQINSKIIRLAEQVKALDSESRRKEDGKILE